MERFEYRVLVGRASGLGSAWFWGSERLGGSDDLELILNQQSVLGWEFMTLAMGPSSSRIVLRRPAQGGELLPAAEPEGRGDELSAPPLGA
jgi:hypothetical protein